MTHIYIYNRWFVEIHLMGFCLDFWHPQSSGDFLGGPRLWVTGSVRSVGKSYGIFLKPYLWLLLPPPKLLDLPSSASENAQVLRCGTAGARTWSTPHSLWFQTSGHCIASTGKALPGRWWAFVGPARFICLHFFAIPRKCYGPTHLW